MSIYDEVAREYGPPPSGDWFAPRPRPRPAAAAEPPPSCPRCAAHDQPYLALHRHLDQSTGSIHSHITALEASIVSALENLAAQADNLDQTLQGAVLPALTELATRAAAAAVAVPEADVQAVADRISTSVSQLVQATQDALAQARTTPPSVPVF